MKKTLVAYFSAEGTTAAFAKTVAAGLDADIFEIRPAVPYTAADLNWMNKNSRSSLEMSDPESRPAIAGDTDISGYDVILLGFPVWWYVEPRIVDTFLESHDFRGKIVIPFATSGGSGIDRASARLKTVCPSADWSGGSRLTAGSAAAWAKSIKAAHLC